jgi:hypothetical protein
MSRVRVGRKVLIETLSHLIYKIIGIIVLFYIFRITPTEKKNETNILHLCTIKTPIYWRIMSAKVGSLCAFTMRKGVKK